MAFNDNDYVRLATGHELDGPVTKLDGSAFDALYGAFFHPTGKCWSFCPDDDDNHFGIRGGRYALVEGWNEKSDYIQILVIGNHKGVLALSIVNTKTLNEREVPVRVTEKANSGSVIHVMAGVRYCEDAVVNGEDESDEDPKMPFIKRSSGDDADLFDWTWEFDIEAETGRIIGWPQGTTAKTFYKVCDCFRFWYGSFEYSGYVPRFMSISSPGYGDYVNLDIQSDGSIAGWDADADISEIKRISHKRS